MNDRQFEQLVQNLQDVMRCPNCSSPYFLEDIHYLGQLDTMTFLHLRCHKCNIPVFASIAVASQDGAIMKVEPEMIEEQIVKKRRLKVNDSPKIFKQITHNDVLEVHEALFKAKGDLSKFLGSS